MICIIRSKDWGDDSDGNCYNQTTPIKDLSYWGPGTSKGLMRVIGEVFSASKVPVGVVNITQLSEYRKDAHTQIYKKQWNPLTPEQIARCTLNKNGRNMSFLVLSTQAYTEPQKLHQARSR